MSYSHDSEGHRQRVLQLADTLRGYGVDAMIDRYREIPPPTSWPAWMHDEIEPADVVLVICTEIYERRLLGRESEGKGLGVRWEGAIITQQTYEEDAHRFVPVVLDPSDVKHVPYFLRPTTHYRVDLEGRQGLEALLRRIFLEPEVQPAPLGARPTFPLSGTPPGYPSVRTDEPPSHGPATRVGPMTRPPDGQSDVSVACEAAIRASSSARGGEPLGQTMLLLRESVLSLARAFSVQVAAPCRITIYGLEVSAAAPNDVSAADTDHLLVRPVVSSSLPEQRAQSVAPLGSVADLNDVWLRGLGVYFNNDLDAEVTYKNSSVTANEQAFRAVMVWPIVRSSHRGSEAQTMLGFLAADCIRAGAFDRARDEPLGALYAGLLAFVLQDMADQAGP